MGRVIQPEVLEEMAIELVRNRHFINELNAYEREAVKQHMEDYVWLHEIEARAGFKNIPQERVDKYHRYKSGLKRLTMKEKLDNLEKFIEDESSPTDRDLSHQQKALLLFYMDWKLEDDAPKRLKDDYKRLTKPGSAGERERRCSGGEKRSLTTRLQDFNRIEPLITSQVGLQKFRADRSAVEKEYEKF